MTNLIVVQEINQRIPHLFCKIYRDGIPYLFVLLGNRPGKFPIIRKSLYPRIFPYRKGPGFFWMTAFRLFLRRATGQGQAWFVPA